jgi:RNA polymerase sigma-70 factor (ECF subfamily)
MPGEAIGEVPFPRNPKGAGEAQGAFPRNRPSRQSSEWVPDATRGRMSISSPRGKREQIVSQPENKAWSSDQELVDEILGGSLEHFELLYEAYFPRVYRFALKRLRDTGEAEDVTQDVFMIVLRALPSYQGQSTLLVWIFGITRNTVNRRFRKKRPFLAPLEEGGALDVAGSEAPADQRVEARRVLTRAEYVIENELTPLQRRIFHLKHLRQQPIRSIALALGKSEDAIKANLYRMRRSIADGTPGLDPLLRD